MIGAGLCLVLAMLFGMKIGIRLVHKSYDLPYLFRSAIKTDGLAIIYIDNESHKELNQVFGQPWDRALHAKLLKKLTREKAKAVVFDIIFDFPRNPESDREFAEAIKENGMVILGADEVGASHQGQELKQKVLPIDLFRDPAKGSGLVLLYKDDQNAIRLHHPGDEQLPSISWRAAEAVSAAVTAASDKRLNERWINYYGEPYSLPSVSYSRVFSNEIPAGYFEGKVVFIGRKPATGFAGAEKDEFTTPYTLRSGKSSSGVEIHATAFLNLARSDWLRRLPLVAEQLVFLLTALVFGYGLTRLRPLPAAIWALVGFFLVVIIAFALVWITHWWFAWMIVVAVQIPAALLWSILYNSLQWYVDKRILTDSLSLHISPSRVKQLMQNKELLKPGARQQEISILFSDIANFSKISERMRAEDLVKMLNNYFESAISAVHQTQGTVVKLIGDAIFAVWNAPEEQKDHQELASKGAIALREQLIEFDQANRALPLRTRVGLHTGTAFVGNFGSSKRFDYTAIGESVNLASRLEGLNKHIGTDVVASRDFQAAVEGKIVTRLIGHFKFKGVDRVVEVHEIIGNLNKEAETKPWRDSFAEAMHRYQRKDFDAAEKMFQKTIELRGEDGPSKFYLQQIADYRESPPSADWAGEVNMMEK